MENKLRTRPLAIAHRGNSSEAPENTRVSFQQAMDLGVDLLEFDVNQTNDGHPVVFHGPDLSKTCGIEGSIRNLSLSEVRRLDVGSWKGKEFKGEGILTLPEMLDLSVGKVNLAVDLKTDEIIPEITSCIEYAGMVDHVVICGCRVSRAKKVRKCNSRLSVGLNMDEEMASLAKMENPARFYREYVRQATRIHLSPLNMNFRYITPELVRIAHLRAIQVWAWTVDEPEEMRRLIRLGVDAIYTNVPKLLLATLDEMN